MGILNKYNEILLSFVEKLYYLQHRTAKVESIFGDKCPLKTLLNSNLISETNAIKIYVAIKT